MYIHICIAIGIYIYYIYIRRAVEDMAVSC